MGNKHSTLKSLFDDIADSIRNKTGSTGDIIADDFPEAIDAIETGIDTSDATAAAGDIASGKTAYVNGVKVTGNITTLYSGNATTVAPASSSISTNTNGEICVTTTVGTDKLYRSGSKHINRLDNTKFGNATADDVVSGKTFTSAAGLKVTGSMPMETWYCTLEDGTVVEKNMLIRYHKISTNTIPNGVLTIVSKSCAGATVTLTPTPDEGYIYSGATVTYTLDGVEQTITLDANTTTFTMPAADVTVTPVWSEVPMVTITLKNYDQYNYGTITYNGVQQTATFTANIGDTIEITRIDVAINDPNATPSRTGYQMINESTSYTVVSDAIFEGKSKFSGNTSTGMYYLLSITEIPEGHALITVQSADKGYDTTPYVNVEYNGVKYGNVTTQFVAKIGDTILCYSQDVNSKQLWINGVNKSLDTSNPANSFAMTGKYSYTVVSDATIAISSETNQSAKITITDANA